MARHGLAKPYNADVLSMIDAYYLIKIIASNMHTKCWYLTSFLSTSDIESSKAIISEDIVLRI